jgi:hypothetical protein
LRHEVASWGPVPHSGGLAPATSTMQGYPVRVFRFPL